jgi:hypothetical protein
LPFSSTVVINGFLPLAILLSSELINRFKTEINNLKNEYNTTLNKVNRLGGGFEVGRIIATQMVHARNRQENYNNLLNWANNVLNQDITNNHIEDLQYDYL